MLREQQKESRRQRVIDAAEALIRESGTTDFSMLTLAARAGLSPATPYNLFGSKGGIMYALLNRAMDTVSADGRSAGKASDPFVYALQLAAAVAGILAADPMFYRPLYRFLLGVRDPVRRPAYMDRGLDYWKAAVEGLHEGDLLPPEIDRDELARELEIHIVGVLDLWVHGELDETEFEAQTVYGAALLLLSVAKGADRDRLMTRVRAARKKLPRGFSYRQEVEEGRHGHGDERRHGRERRRAHDRSHGNDRRHGRERRQ